MAHRFELCLELLKAGVGRSDSVVHRAAARLQSGRLRPGVVEGGSEVVQKIGRTLEKGLEAFPRSEQGRHLFPRCLGLAAGFLELPACPTEIGVGAAEGRGRRGYLVLSQCAATGDVSPLLVEQVCLDGQNAPQMILEIGLELLVAFGLFRLTFDFTKGPFDLADHVIEPQEILAGVLELELGLVLTCLVAGDPGRLFEEDSTVGRPGGKDLTHPTLLDDRVGPGAESDRGELVEDVFQTHAASVEPVLRGAGTEDPASHLEPAIGFFPVAVVGLEDQGHFGGARRRSRRGAGEHYVAHLLEPHQRWTLFAEHPQDGVYDVRLAATVWADDRRHLSRKGEFHLVRKRLKTGEPECLKANSRHCRRKGTRTGHFVVANDVTE